jgi:ankyrin repeat protein
MDRVRRYPLHEAAVRGDSEAVLRLINSGVDVNALDNADRTPVACAIAGEE